MDLKAAKPVLAVTGRYGLTWRGRGSAGRSARRHPQSLGHHGEGLPLTDVFAGEAEYGPVHQGGGVEFVAVFSNIGQAYVPVGVWGGQRQREP